MTQSRDSRQSGNSLNGGFFLKSVGRVKKKPLVTNILKINPGCNTKHNYYCSTTP